MNQPETPNQFAYGVEVTLKTPDSFNILKETLTRIGIASKKGKILFQSCHILHKRGKYYIIGFKELFMLDGKHSEISDDDYRRRNAIAKLLHAWGLCVIVDESRVLLVDPDTEISVIPFKDKKEWQLVPKYSIGSRL